MTVNKVLKKYKSKVNNTKRKKINQLMLMPVSKD